MKIDVVIPPGRHSWNLGQGWVHTLQQMGWLGQAFYALPENAEGIVSYAKAPQSDLVLLMGGDHHLSFLHDTERKRDAWRKSLVPTLCICYESILDSRFKDSLKKSKQSLSAFTHFAFSDEKDSVFFENHQTPAFWMPQCVDANHFTPGRQPRLEKVFFRGKHDLSLYYDTRHSLLKTLVTLPSFDFIEHEISDQQLMETYALYAATINLPNNFFGYNVRTFEALASGCVLFQNRISDRPKNQALFSEDEIVLYDSDDPQTLIRMIEEFSSHSEIYAKTAKRGRDACLAAHTIEHRIKEIVGFIEASYKQSKKLHIGCGTIVLPTFLNVDCRSLDSRVSVQNALQLPDIPNLNADLLYACHVLEHFPTDQIQSILSTWRLKLRRGGRIYLSVPDMKFLSFMYIIGKPLSRILPPLFGGQEYQENYHKTAFDKKYLTKALKNAGFIDIRAFNPFKLHFTQFDFSRWSLSLNLTAINSDHTVPAPKRNIVKEWIESMSTLIWRYTKGLRKF